MFELSRNHHNHQVGMNNPFHEIEEFERNFFADPFGGFFENRDLSEFKTDVTDEGNHYLLEADLPGFDKKDIHLDLQGDTLTIEAERHSIAEDKDSKNKVIRMERSYGAYSRQFNISEIDGDHIKASYDNGVLKLILPKRQTAEPQKRTLEIE